MGFECQFCSLHTLLKWPENYTKGMRPLEVETERPHKCEMDLRKKTVFYGADRCPACRYNFHKACYMNDECQAKL